MSNLALFRPGRRPARWRVQRVGLSLAVLSMLSLVLGVLAPTSTAQAAAHVPSAPTHPMFFHSRTMVDASVQSFHFFSSTEAAVLGNNGNLWLEQGPFGTVPPGRTLVRGNLTSFQALSDTEFLGLEEDTVPFGSDTFLFLIHAPFGPNNATVIDVDAQAYQGLSDNEILVLGNDGKLWLEFGPFSNGFSGRVQVDANVASFSAFSDNEILVKGTDNKLWLEHGPFGHVPPGRVQVDGNVQSFQALSDTQILVKGFDNKLWLEHAPFGNVPPGRVQIDGSVLDFQGIDINTVVVEGQNENLWLEHSPFGNVPPARQQIDASVSSGNGFQPLPLSPTLIGVRGNDDVLWLEQGPF